MHHTILVRLVSAVSFLAAVASAGSTVAQMVPYGGSYGGWGAFPGQASFNQSRRIAAGQQSQAQSRAIRQNTTVQQGIRNTLTTQARGRTQAIQQKQQSGRDWWFQHQQQQINQFDARSRSASRPPVPNLMPSSIAAATMQSSAPQASTDVIKWPRTLQDPRFAQQRTRVEAPYRTEGDPTVEDYRAMIDATGQMKTILKDMVYQISAGDYMAMEKFLDALAGEARERIERKTGAAAAEKPAVAEDTGN